MIPPRPPLPARRRWLPVNHRNTSAALCTPAALNRVLGTRSSTLIGCSQRKHTMPAPRRVVLTLSTTVQQDRWYLAVRMLFTPTPVAQWRSAPELRM